MIDSRVSREGAYVRRRRECVACGQRFTTQEEVVPTEVVVIKNDERREEFNPQKVRNGLKKACWKRPVSEEQLDGVLSRLELWIDNQGEKEVQSRAIGEFVLGELRKIDEVALVRFASVYRQFNSLDQFIDEVRHVSRDKR